jgi:uncharacterized protein
MKIILLVLGILLLFFAVIEVNTIFSAPSANINGYHFSLYLARTTQDQEVGLAKFKNIENNHGMLFIFTKTDYYSFWMKNMKFPIDIIFLNNNKIADIFQNVPVQNNNDLPIYTTKKPADMVLEINAGLSKKYNIKIGDTINLNL